jgi:hypothetical protein
MSTNSDYVNHAILLFIIFFYFFKTLLSRLFRLIVCVINSRPSAQHGQGYVVHRVPSIFSTVGKVMDI